MWATAAGNGITDYRLWRHSKLVDRANQWLRRRRHHGDGDVTTTVKTCETMTWMSRDVSQLTDSESMVTSKSVVDGADTYYLRGLRLCFFYIITDHSCLEVASIPAETCHVCRHEQSQLSLFQYTQDRLSAYRKQLKTRNNFLSKLGRKISFQSGDDREASFLFQRISVLIRAGKNLGF